MSNTPQNDGGHGASDQHDLNIFIDREKFRVDPGTLTAEKLRALPDPDIGVDRDLYREALGNDEDELITAGTVVTLKNGMHFFTAPASIQPGRAC